MMSGRRLLHHKIDGCHVFTCRPYRGSGMCLGAQAYQPGLLRITPTGVRNTLISLIYAITPVTSVFYSYNYNYEKGKTYLNLLLKSNCEAVFSRPSYKFSGKLGSNALSSKS